MGLYYVLWAILIGASLWVSLGGFLWAYRHGQLKDQERARFLPLRGETVPLVPENTRKARRETAVAATILLMGLLSILAALVITLLRAHGGRT
jgi:hypothetical protein